MIFTICLKSVQGFLVLGFFYHLCTDFITFVGANAESLAANWNMIIYTYSATGMCDVVTLSRWTICFPSVVYISGQFILVLFVC